MCALALEQLCIPVTVPQTGGLNGKGPQNFQKPQTHTAEKYLKEKGAAS
jgi:hypothetical protein